MPVEETKTKEIKPKVEEKLAEAEPKVDVKSDVIMRKGPRPRGLAKFAPVKTEEAPVEQEELSEGQKRKIEMKKKKALEELNASEIALKK